MTVEKASCLVAGSINIDEFYHLPHIVRPGETISSTGFERREGGKGGNQAIAIARASGSKSNESTVRLDAAIGVDGEYLLPILSDAGVNVSSVEVVKTTHTGRAIIQSSADGENSIVLFPGANATVRPAVIPDGTSHVVVQNEIPLESTLAYLRTAASRGLTTVINPSPMPSTAILKTFPWETVNWLLVNEGEAGDIVKAFDSESTENVPLVDGLPKEAAEALAIINRLRSLNQFSTVSFACTLGAAGVLIVHVNGEVLYRPAAKLDNPLKDTTGAGDCFAGYFTAGLMRGDDMSRIVEESLTACSICVERPGAAGSIPTRDEVLARLAARA